MNKVLVYPEVEWEIWMDLATFLDHILNSGVASIKPYFKFPYQVHMLALV